MARADTLDGNAARGGGGAGRLPPTRQKEPGAGLTVHLVGRLTTPVMSFLLPTLKAMHAIGLMQALVCVDDANARIAKNQLPTSVQVIPVRDGHVLGRTNGLHTALAQLASQGEISALYLHGLLPGLAAMRWLRIGTNRAVNVVFSPHDSRALINTPVLSSVLARLLQLGLGKGARHAIVNLQPEADLLAPLYRRSVKFVESPVPQVFFDTPRHEARRPLLVSCNLDGQRAAVDGFARIAVLLNDVRLGFSFNWVGRAEPEAAAALKAANVGQFAADSDASRAQRLSTAWIYVAPTEERGFPVRLAEAMASGLPCVVLDTSTHRGLVDDGTTGYLCSDLKTMLQRIAELSDSSALRQTQGAQARQVALERFSESTFRQQLMEAMDQGLSDSPGAKG